MAFVGGHVEMKLSGPHHKHHANNKVTVQGLKSRKIFPFYFTLPFPPMKITLKIVMHSSSFYFQRK